MALPEIDGQIVSRPVSFKTLLDTDPETKADLVGYWPVTERIAFVAEVTRSRVGLRTKPVPERRVALIFSNHPNRDGRVGNGVGLDTPALAIAILQALEGRLPDHRCAGRQRDAGPAAAGRPDQLEPGSAG